MSKKTLLSPEISRSRAMLLGGASSVMVLGELRKWSLRLPRGKLSRMTKRIEAWNQLICSAIQDCLPLGTPLGHVLREIFPIIRRDERACMKFEALERQFALQGAVALVAPWAVAALGDGIHLDAFSVAGASCQSIGILVFACMIAKLFVLPRDEGTWLFGFLVCIWVRVLAGMVLQTAMVISLEKQPTSVFKAQWKLWVQAFQGGATESIMFSWPKEMLISAEVARLLESLVRTGAPASSTLSDYIQQLEDEKQSRLEEHLSGLPTKTSIIFCVFFTPAVFLIFLSSIWPTLSSLEF